MHFYYQVKIYHNNTIKSTIQEKFDWNQKEEKPGSEGKKT